MLRFWPCVDADGWLTMSGKRGRVSTRFLCNHSRARGPSTNFRLAEITTIRSGYPAETNFSITQGHRARKRSSASQRSRLSPSGTPCRWRLGLTWAPQASQGPSMSLPTANDSLALFLPSNRKRELAPRLRSTLSSIGLKNSSSASPSPEQFGTIWGRRKTSRKFFLRPQITM